MNEDFTDTVRAQLFVAIASLQVSLVADFYSDLLSFLTDKEDSTTPFLRSPTYVEFHAYGLKLAIFEPSSAHAVEFSQPSSGPMSLCLEVSDLAAAIAHLTSLGYPPPGDIIQASHGSEIYAYDPDGNRLILHQS